MFEEYREAREELISRMKQEMLGPGSEPRCVDIEHEMISVAPDTRYCVGILYPQKNTLNMEDDDVLGVNSSSTSDEDVDENNILVNNLISKNSHVESKSVYEDDDLDETVSMTTKLLPSSMGLTFLSNVRRNTVNVHVEFATYRIAKIEDCVMVVADNLRDRFEIPREFEFYYSYEKSTGKLRLKEKIEKRTISEIYAKDTVEDYDGIFKDYAYQLAQYLKTGYVREPHKFDVSVDFSYGDYFNPEKTLDGTIAKVSALRYKLLGGFYSYTIMLTNTKNDSMAGKDMILQPHIRISSEENDDLCFCDYSSIEQHERRTIEEQSNDLLYRNKKNYSTGLGVATAWDISSDGKGYVETDYFPRVEVPQMEFAVDSKYNVSSSVFSMKYMSDLCDADKNEKISKMQDLVNAYEAWINELTLSISKLEVNHKAIADVHINNCKQCLKRMKEGIEILKNDELTWKSFVLANRAMFMQRVHINLQNKYEQDLFPDDENLSDDLENINYYNQADQAFWRPFQLAFLLMSIKSMTLEESNSDRELVDLIWFPTGGGKTEAYLGLTAFTIFYRRLRYLDASDGTTVIMRYTLRLLAAQQFTRASTLICACELIRKETDRRISKYPKYPLGKKRITIGLWIGGEHTPNKLKGTESSAKKCYDELTAANTSNLKNTKERYNKFQVLKCPWCGTKLVKEVSADGKKLVGKWGYVMNGDKSFGIECPTEACPFNSSLPIQVVDEELYKNPPTLLFATVDKFAMFPWYKEIGNFFAVNSDNRPPELIIQDELHLISGPLGSMVGLYESIIDYLCSKKGIKPKIIASTATICRAKEQCSALYDREVFQFPPQGLDESDSFFARSADVSKNHGRVYIGLLPSGKTKAMMESRVLASILQIEKQSDLEDEIKDKYWTLTTYFNSLKELGKCSTIVQNDVRDNIRRMAHRNMYIGGIRNIIRADELTSRVSTTELNETLNKLEKVHYVSEVDKDKGQAYASNLLLATNMISVGIDVDRLNAMVMVGQPKLTSEYIQASSRVGRKYPGVVFTMYDSARSRDRSHYEQFKAYHESFYKYVEPTGVTPYSEPARARALHAIVVSMLRHGEGLSTDDILSTFDKEKMHELLGRISDYILNRITSINSRLNYNIDSDSMVVDSELEEIYEKIDILAKQADHTNLVYGNVMGLKPKKEGQVRILKPFGVDDMEPITFDTMTSMRNVDTNVNVNIIVLGD